MSYSVCINCAAMVPAYEKYCATCLKRYPQLQQTEDFWKHYFYTWDAARALAHKEIAMTPNTKPLAPHQDRVVTERLELMFKIDKLTEFLKGPTFQSLSSDEQERLTRQHEIMGQYGNVLAERIAHFS